VAGPLGRQITYTYDGGNLATVTDAMGYSTLYYYNADHRLRSSVNRVGGMLNFTYEDGTVAGVTRSLYDSVTGLPTSQYGLYSISYGKNVTTFRDALGGQTVVHLDSNGRPTLVIDPLGNSTCTAWDSNGRRAGYRDENGGQSSFSYDSCGNLTGDLDPLGNETTWQWSTVLDTPNRYMSEMGWVEDANGSRTTFEYDSSGNMNEMTGPLGHGSLATFDSHGYMTSYMDLNGGVTTYTYDTHGNRLTVTDPLGNAATSTYDVVGRLLTETDGNGNTTTHEYDANDRLTLETDPLAGVTEHFCNEEGSRIRTVDPAGRVTEYSNTLGGYVDSVSDPAGNETSYVYDARGNLLGSTDAAGGVTGMTHDPLGRITSVTDALGNTTSYTYDPVGNQLSETDANGNTTAYSYDPLNRLTGETDPLGNSTSYTYDAVDNLLTTTDPLGNTTTFGYDLVNRITQVNQSGAVQSFTWDGNSNLLTATDPLGNVTAYTYDAANRRTGATDALGGSTVFAYDGVGNLTSTTDRNGGTTAHAYDALNRLTGATNALGGATAWTYDAAGNRITETDALGNVTTYGYDLLGRRTSMTDPTGAVSGYSYDSLGNVLAETDANGNTTTYAYDALNRLIGETDPLGNAITHEYDAVGNRIGTTDANGSATGYQYDALNRLITQTDALGQATTFTYDALGNVTGLTDANGNTTTHEYDAWNRLVRTGSALGHATTYTYDAAGNLLSRTDANGSATTYSYDALNRLNQTAYPVVSTVSYTYDAEGNITQMANTGGLGETTTNAYDAVNRITSTTVDYGTFSRTIGYTFDAVGNRATMTDPDGGLTNYGYDPLGRLLTADGPAGVTTYEYDAIGARSRRISPNGSVTDYTFDAADRLLSIENSTSGSAVISSYAYTYDGAGNRLSVTDAVANVTGYTYDALGQLVNVDYPSGESVSYAYDPAGNRLTESHDAVTTNYAYDADYRLLTAGTTTYAYDSNGNLTQKTEGTDVTGYQYDYENRLTQTTLPDASQVSHQYAPYGDRLTRTDGDGTTYFFQDINDVLLEMDGTGSTLARYTHGPGIDEPIVVDRGGTPSFYHYDGLGSVTSLSDATEGTVATYTYDVFGAITGQTGSVENRYTFTGREYDADTGLYYLRARYYDPEAGRFTSPDPWGASLTELNPYAYARNNPATLVDLFGGRSGGRRFNGIRYSHDEYDEDCLDRAWKHFQKINRKLGKELDKITKKLNKMLRKMRADAKERADSSVMHALIGTFVGVAVGALVGALTLNPVAGALAGSAASAAYTAATSGSLTGTDAAQGAVGTLASIAGTFAGSVGSTVNLYWSTYNADRTLSAELDRINDVAGKLQQDVDKLSKGMSEEAAKTYDKYAQENCKIRKEPPVTTPPITTGPDRPVTGRVPTGETTYGGRSTTGTRHSDLEVTSREYVDPPETTVPVQVTVTNRGLQETSGHTIKTDVFSPPTDRSILLVADESHGQHYFYQYSLNRLGVTYDTVLLDDEYCPLYEDADPDTKDLKDYDVVLWECSYDDTGILEDPAQAELSTYLDNHGCLGVFGNGIMVRWPESTGTLMSDYLFANGGGDQFTGPRVDGVPNTWGQGFSFDLEIHSENHGIAGVKPGGQVAFLTACQIASIQADTGEYKGILSTITIDAMNTSSDPQRDELMTAVLEFLDCRYRHPGGNGGPPPTEVPPLTPGETTTVTVPVPASTGANTTVFTLHPPDSNTGNNSSTTTVVVKGETTPPVGDTFDDPVTGEPDRSGWTQHDDSPKSRNRTCFMEYMWPYCGSGSWWCGSYGYDWLTGTTFLNGPGYGNNWYDTLVFPDIPIPQGVNPAIGCALRYDTQPGSDYVYLDGWNWGTGQWQTIDQFSGNSGGWIDEQFWTVPDGLHSTLRFRFRFESDAQGSDEDGGFDCEGGAYAIDNVRVINSDTGEMYYFNSAGDIPGMDMGAWPMPWGEGVGTFWDLYYHNDSWQWACFDPDTSLWPYQMVDRLTMPPTDISMYNQPVLYYDIEMDLPDTNWDTLFINVTTDGQSWTQVGQLGGSWGDQAATPIGVTQYKSETFQVAFVADAWGDTHTYGVYLDNVGIREGAAVLQPPIADFTGTPFRALVDEQVSFDASDSVDPDGEIVSYQWDFGDGTTATGVVVNHTYDSPWRYPVTLTATDNDGLSDTVVREFDVAIVYPNESPGRPTNVSPANGQNYVGTGPTLEGSAFSDIDAGDTHAGSQWQITDIAGDYMTPVFDSGEDAVNLTSITVPTGTLPFETDHWWRTRYRDNNGNWSLWSWETGFTTVPESAPVQAAFVDGWNIFGLAGAPVTGFTASTLAADINGQGGDVSEVFWWNAPAGTWDFYLVDVQYGTDFDIELGNGYLLKNSAATTWTYHAAPLPPAPGDVVLVDGWNLPALPVQPFAAYTASTMAAEINAQGGNVTEVFWWNAPAGTWDFWLVDVQYGTDFNIEPGEGYLLKNGAPATWTIPGN